MRLNWATWWDDFKRSIYRPCRGLHLCGITFWIMWLNWSRRLLKVNGHRQKIYGSSKNVLKKIDVKAWWIHSTNPVAGSSGNTIWPSYSFVMWNQRRWKRRAEISHSWLFGGLLVAFFLGSISWTQVVPLPLRTSEVRRPRQNIWGMAAHTLGQRFPTSRQITAWKIMGKCSSYLFFK